MLRARTSLRRAALVLAAALAWVSPAAADQPIGGACTTGTADGVQSVDGNNVVCIGSVWQYPAYQFGASSATCNGTNAGITRYNAGSLQYCNSSVWTTLAATGTVALSGLVAATTTNSIDSSNWAQTWRWNTLAGTSALTLTSTSTAAASNAQKLLNISLSGTNATSAQTTYGTYISNTHAGTTSTNVGLYATATGGTAANYAAIFDQGNVGIGTTAPSSPLAVAALAANQGVLKIGPNSSSAGDEWWLGFDHDIVSAGSADSNDRARIGVDIVSGGAGRLFFTTGYSGSQAKAMWIGETGNVGIGTTNPTTPLYVVGNQNSSPYWQLALANTSTGATAYSQIGFVGTGRTWTTGVGNSSETNYGVANKYFVYDSGAGAIRMAIDTSGNVGIGTTSPLVPLHVETDQDAATQVYVKNTTNSANAQAILTAISSAGALDIAATATSNSGFAGSAYIWNEANTDLLFATNSTEHMRLTAGGNLGIGTTSPSAQLANTTTNYLDTSGNGNSTTAITWASSNGGYVAELVNLSSSGSPANGVLIQTPNATSASDKPLKVETGGVSRFIVNGAGNVGIGTTSPNQPLEVQYPGSSLHVYLGNPYTNGSNQLQYAGLGIGTSGAAGNGNYVVLSDGGNTWINAPGAGGTILFRANSNGNTALFIDGTSTNVGVDTISPTAPLDVAGPIRSEADSYVSSDFSKTSSTALAAITGLTSGTLAAGKAYAFDIWLYTTSNASGGIKVDLNGGTATATTLIGDSQEWDGTSIGVRTAFSALNTALCAITAVATATCHITGTIIVNGAGTLKPEFAQNASNGTASKVKTGSVMLIRQLN